MLMNEIFNSSIPLRWQEDNDVVFAKFVVNEKMYVLKIMPHTYQFNETIYNFLNVSFSRVLENGNETIDLTLDSPDAPTVLGIVINGAASKIQQYRADAIMLAASNNVDKRMKLYTWIANHFHPVFGTMTPVFSLGNHSQAVALLSSTIPREVHQQFIEYLKTLQK